MNADQKLHFHNKWKSVAVKVAAVWAAFLILHYAYDFFPSDFTRFFSAINESVFQHMKIGFWAYTLVSGMEYWFTRKHGERIRQFVPSRVLGVLMFLWAMVIFFYFAPAILGGPMPSEFLEIVNANIVLMLSVFSGVVFEQELQDYVFSKTTSAVLWLMYLVLFLEFSIFTYRLPWADLYSRFHRGIKHRRITEANASHLKVWRRVIQGLFQLSDGFTYVEC